MKVLFSGPSLANAAVDFRGIEKRPPAECGDIVRAVLQGATVVGLVDGAFGSVASVWHKEILYALSCGVHVLGSSSMGALRAAECASFGMEPIGTIANAYLSGELDDDADVALLMLPDSAGGGALTDPLVDALATLRRLESLALISPAELETLVSQARGLHFTERTGRSICGILGDRSQMVEDAYVKNFFSIKQADALELVKHMMALPDQRKLLRPDWDLSQPPLWQRVLSEHQRSETNLQSSTVSFTPILESTLPR